ncbi:MAG: LuxR C-terminal-related transcriptional regulator [Actinomycetota bacterium]|nr:LuxR C-terminal-related transcriptional regulator [Actinomycetota bacterium]
MTMARADRLREARESFVEHQWSDACTHFEAVDEEEPLGSDDLERLAAAQYLIGRELESVDTWSRAFHISREQDEPARAARCGFWVGFVLLNRSDLPGGNGWIARVRRVLAGVDAGVVEAGYLRYLVALRAIFDGDAEGARAGFEQATQICVRFGDRDLETLALLGQGRAVIRLGRPEDGVACLDEAIVAVTSGEVSPIVVGDSYCTAIEGCQELFDLHRAQRWTEDLTRWCENHPDLVAFRGQCLLHRAEVLQLRGSWPDALSEVDRALEYRGRPAGQLATGAVYYQQGELHRLRGEVEQAEVAYEEARRRGRQPQPGLALLRLAGGQVAKADAAIRRALAEADDPTMRSWLLPAAVEVLVAAGDIDAALEACSELETTAAGYRSQMLDAVTAHSRGMIRVAADEPEDALPLLRRAMEKWHALDVPYETARVHVLIGHASRALGDDEGTRSEWAAARETFAGLGAQPDLERLDGLTEEEADRKTHGLSARQLEVLQHVAAGRTNREIADALVISRRTVERHVSDIFTKLEVPSRAAATAYAYEHDLI